MPLIMFILLGMLSRNAFAAGDMSVHVIYLKDPSGGTGYGDAVLIESDGHFLLMDTGSGTYPYTIEEADKYKSTTKSVISYLQKVGAGKDSAHPLDIYLSHPHSDHYGGIWDVVTSGKFCINNLYLPDRSLCNAVRSREYIYGMGAKLSSSYGLTVRYLTSPYLVSKRQDNSATSFACGSAKIDVIGPTKIYTPGAYSMTTQEAENNNSLCAMVTCGSFKFLTMGDALAQSEMDMIAARGTGLQADLVKQNHHGHVGGNSTAFINTVKAQRAFATKMFPGYYSVVVTRAYNEYGESLVLGDAGHSVVYQKNASTGKVERSVCSHPLYLKTFSRKASSLTTDACTIVCQGCNNTVVETEYHKCTHKFNKKTGSCTNQPYCYYICKHPKWSKSGVCKVCKFKCTHCKINPKNNQYYKTKKGDYIRTFNKKTGRCKVCGAYCAHKSFNKTTHKCRACGFKCKHIKINKKTHKYVKKKGKYVRSFSKKGVCTICRYRCKHKKKKKGICPICKKKLG